MLSNIVVTGGGTGGHVFTGLAILDEVKRRNPGAHTGFVGSAVGRERELVPRSVHTLHVIGARPIRLNGLSSAARGLASVPSATVAASRILRRLQPELVVGVGGPASGPTLLAARTLGLETCLHEQNSVPGLANSLAGTFVSNVFVGLPQVRGRFVDRADVVVTGNPVRESLRRRLCERRAAPCNTGGSEDPLSVLVLGGSDGSRFLNSRMPEVIARATRQAAVSVSVYHQAGSARTSALETAYRKLGVEAEVVSFVDDIATAYQRADLAIALAGAGTLAELALAALPSVIVPLATAADDHQRENARYFARNGGICLLDQRGWTDADASAQLARLFVQHLERVALGERLRTLGRPRAAEVIVDHLEQVAADQRAGGAPARLTA